jgi:YD repeat-containing protein
MALVCAVAVTACTGGGDGSDRMAVKITEVERTRTTTGSTTIERRAVTYDGSRLVEITNTLNATPNGTARVTYDGSVITRVEYTDKEGDRATDQLVYADGQLVKLRYEIPNVMTTEQSYTYFAEDRDLLKEVMTVNTPKGGLATSRMSRYEYDAETRIAKVTTTQGTDMTAVEYRYNTDGQLDRATFFSSGTVVETYTFSYLQDGKLDEIFDSNNNRYDLTYDKSGKITEIRHTTTSGITTTTRYTYGEGAAQGWTFSPEIPGGELFDLGGRGYTALSMLHGAVPDVGDIPKPFVSAN